MIIQIRNTDTPIKAAPCGAWRTSAAIYERIIKVLVRFTVWCVLIISAYGEFNDDTREGFFSRQELEIALGLNTGELQKRSNSIRFRFDRTETWDWDCWPFGGEIQHLSSTMRLTDFLATFAVRKGVAGLILGFAVSTGQVLISDPEIPPGTCPDGSDPIGDVTSVVGRRLLVSADDGQNWFRLLAWPDS